MGGLSLPARRDRQGAALIIFFAGYLVVHRDALALAGKRFAGLDLPRARDLGPILLAWLASLGILVFQRDLGSSLLFFGMFVVLLYVATERAAWLVSASCSSSAVPTSRYPSSGTSGTASTIWLDPFGIPDDVRPDRATRSSSRSTGWRGRADRHRSRPQGHPE